MLSHGVMFLVVGLLAGALNLAGVPSVTFQISWSLYLIGTLLVSISVIAGRTVQVAPVDRQRPEKGEADQVLDSLRGERIMHERFHGLP